MTAFDRTINWDEYWESDLTAFDEQWKTTVAYELADMLEETFELVGGVNRVASVGCGPATTLLDIAERHPEMKLRGYDPATAVLDQVHQRVAASDLNNVVLHEASLPDIDVDETFDVVYCFNTLHYVADVEAAVRNLFELVRSDGLLLFTYPTEADRRWLRDELRDPSSTLVGDHDSDWLRERFQLVISGENVVDRDDLRETLDHDVNHLRELGIVPPEVYGERLPYAAVRK